MSRALDKGVLREVLQNDNHEEVFENIAAVLVKTWGDLLEIELLGHLDLISLEAPFVQDGNAVGFLKPRLVQAFVVARKILMGHIQQGKYASREDLIKATAVVLVMDPEHLTAANTRKRILIDVNSGGKAIAESLKLEKYFIDSLLTSRLRRHTKSPILWSHRRWLMAQFRAHGIPTNVAFDIKRVVCVSGERHPRNYYAWCHARYLVEGLDLETLSMVLADTKQWCFLHPGDVSGWSFLGFLLSRAPADIEPILVEALNLTESFRWQNETVWYFLRNIMAQEPAAQGQVDKFRQVWKSQRDTTAEESNERRTLDQAMSWVEYQTKQ